MRSSLRNRAGHSLCPNRRGNPPASANKGACASQVSIPLERGSESLNVAAAAAIALYERRRSRD